MTENIVTRNTLFKYQSQLSMQKYVVEQIAPEATFVFLGIDNEYIYFNIVAKKIWISNEQIADLKEKTRFEIIAETSGNILYELQCKVEIK